MHNDDWVTANRLTQKWTGREQLGRIVWALVLPLFRFSPRPLWAWRRMLLRIFGAHVAKGVHVYPTVNIAIPWNLSLGEKCAIGDRVNLYSLGRVSIGARATVSQGAHVCAGTHDLKHPSRPLIKAPVNIGPDAWVCADVFLGPGVSVGQGAVVGARAVVVRDVADYETVVGNPARIVKSKNSSL